MSINEEFKVLEIFPSIQGEGTRMGELTFFIRLSGCNLDCVWCDTKEQMSKDAITMPFLHVLSELHNSGMHNICFTGGEPLLQFKQIQSFMKLYIDKSYRVSMETNGILVDKISAKYLGDIHFVVSPKLVSSFGDTMTMNELMNDERLNPSNIVREWIHTTANLEFKFVAGSDDDLTMIVSIIEKFKQELRDISITIQPEFSPNKANISEYMESLLTLENTIQQNEISRSFNTLRVGIQLHKLMNVR